MPADFTLPPDTRAVGTGNPPLDMDNVVDALTAMGAGLNVLNAAYAGGADPTGAADSTAAIQAAINALPAAGGAVYLPAGTYKVSSTLTMASLLYAYVRGAGRWATKINFTGTGDCLRVYDTDTTGRLTGGGLLDFTIDGTSAGAGSAGLHYGDMRLGELRLAVENFSGTGSIGVHFDNQNAWTERCHGYLRLTNNTQNLMFDVSGNTTATNSFGYSNFDVEMVAKANQDGVVLQNGALYYNSRLCVKGNFQGSSSAQTNAVLRITGTVPAGHPAAGNGSALNSTRLDLQAECISGTGSNVPQTINLGTLGTNKILGCTGIMDFAQGSRAFAVTNWGPLTSAGTLIYDGVIRGDFNLNSATVGLGTAYSMTCTGVRTYAKSLLASNNGNLFVDSGDFFNQTLTQSITISLNPAAAATLGGAQRKTVIITQAASGGPYTVAWPVSGSPTTSAPTVVWPGGVAPVMPAAPNADLVVHLVTYDGATWYGQALQGGAPADPLPPWTAADAGLLAESFDPAASAGTTLLVAGTLYLIRLNIRAPMIVSNVVVNVVTAGAGASTQSFAGLYSSSGTLLSGSSDIGSQLTSTGNRSLALTTPQALAAGTFAWAAVLVNLGTTQPTLARASVPNATFNGGLTSSNFRTCVNGTGLTALPAPITVASNTLVNSSALWAAAS